MVRITHFKDPLTHTLIFDSKDGRRRQVTVETEDEWRQDAFVKSVATIVTGKDQTRLQESIEVVDRDGRRLYYLEKL